LIPLDHRIETLGRGAKAAQRILAQSPLSNRNRFLSLLQDGLIHAQADIMAANDKDRDGAQSRLSPAQLDRLILTPARIKGMADSLDHIIAQPDPCGEILDTWQRPNGLVIQKITVPIGVIGMIFESRPNVAIDAAALCVKSKNAIILRGGSESMETIRMLHGVIKAALRAAGLPEDCVQILPSQDRTLVGELLKASQFIDVMIPRGGKSLTARVMDEARMPVFAHLDGNCHLYIHDKADLSMSLSVVENAKLRRTGVCGALESLLLDDALPDSFAREIITMLLSKGVEIRGDARAQKLNSAVIPAQDDDWAMEYLAPIISLAFIGGVGGAAAHINHYGSHHTDGIITDDETAAAQFMAAVDSAIVLHNASTQFADGGEFGFGAEIGIGTGKLHARGPVGLRQLTTFQYHVLGSGQVRA